jgi:hypothetical protein
MMSTGLRIGSAGVFLLAVGALSTAQQPVRPVQPEPNQPTSTSATFRAKQVLGSKIMIQNNTAIGTVDDIVFDQAGNLEYLLVENQGKLISVPWDAPRFDLKSQTAVIDITPDVYKTIPTFTATTYPDFWAPTYRTTTYKYYNINPRELRRLQRIIKR